jgi:hypothetical protein
MYSSSPPSFLPQYDVLSFEQLNPIVAGLPVTIKIYDHIVSRWAFEEESVTCTTSAYNMCNTQQLHQQLLATSIQPLMLGGTAASTNSSLPTPKNAAMRVAATRTTKVAQRPSRYDSRQPRVTTPKNAVSLAKYEQLIRSSDRAVITPTTQVNKGNWFTIQPKANARELEILRRMQQVMMMSGLQ